ncbi:hypothetical protein ABZX30_02625 [Streptomyces sp. NPDC004542]|uniref:hypothetical protein n=1 Tax=Streptomyces sp. NPDC004542 TaxID=3154281 RepID=UPI0033B7EAE3
MTAAALPGLPRTVLRLHRWALLAWAGFVAGTTGWLVWLTTAAYAVLRRRTA